MAAIINMGEEVRKEKVVEVTRPDLSTRREGESAAIRVSTESVIPRTGLDPAGTSFMSPRAAL